MPFLPLLEITVPGAEPQDETQLDASNPLPSDSTASSIPPSSNSVRFELSFDGDIETSPSSSGEQSPLRGRTLRRMPAKNRTPSRTRTQRDLTRVSTGLGSVDFRERFLSRDFTLTPEEYHDGTVLEPLPPKRLRLHSLTEELHRSTSLENFDFLGNFVGHRDTFAILGISKSHEKANELPDEFYKRLAFYADCSSYKALRLSCRTWSEAITRAKPISRPVGNWLPNEVLEKILCLLEPADFNAARHSCRAWMIASLEERLLIRMLLQGGWRSASQLDVAQLKNLEGRKTSIISKDWLLSKRLALECALVPRFTGTESERWDAVHSKLYKANCRWDCGILLTSKTDFSQLATTPFSPDEDPPLLFTISVCQKYLLVGKDRTIHIYCLGSLDPNPPHEYGGCLRTMTSINCPERVLAMSMDTSSGRFAVAALLQERIGLVCNIEHRGQVAARRLSMLPQASNSFSEDSYHNHAITNDPSENLLVLTAEDSSNNQPFWQQTDFMDASSGSRSIYRKLCSARDPPRSVAICPQRRCVAFGNSAGIELHWIDVLSGQDLQRWFSLSSASDSLYFLPSRFGIDSMRKLRVIASAAHPAQTKIADYMYPSRAMRMAKRTSWDLQTSENGVWRLDWSAPRRVSAGNLGNRLEHHSARPLSDGHHILFINPSNSKLCLGRDVWPAQVTTELSRQIVFEGPSKGLIPFVYAAGTELRWGVRVVAGYVREHDLDGASELWLFTVPSDIFFVDDNIGSTEMANEDEGGVTVPLSIHGIHFGKVHRLADLAVDATDGDLTIRAFSAEGTAYTWQIAGSGRRDIVKRAVLEDGATIAIVVDGEEEDTVMQDMSSVDQWAFDFDGASSRLTQEASGNGRVVDVDGDVVMTEAPAAVPPMEHATGDAEDEGYFSDEGPAVNEYEQAGGLFAIHAPPVPGRWSGSEAEWVPQYLAEHSAGIEDEGVGLDVLGMTRLEVELLGL